MSHTLVYENLSFSSLGTTVPYRRIISPVATSPQLPPQIPPQVGDIAITPNAVFYGAQDTVITIDGASTEVVVSWKSVSDSTKKIKFPGTDHVLVESAGAKWLWKSNSGIRSQKSRKNKGETQSISLGLTSSSTEDNSSAMSGAPPSTRSSSPVPSIAASSRRSQSVLSSEQSSNIPNWTSSVNESINLPPTPERCREIVSQVPENEWLLPLWDRWNEPGISRVPTFPHGRSIIEHLLSLPSPIPQWSNYLEYADVVPGMHDLKVSHVITDILNNKDDVDLVITDCETKDGVYEMNITHVLSHFMASSNVSSWTSENRLLAIIDVPFTDEGSFQIKTTLPESLSVEGCIAASTPKGKKLPFSSSLCPPGSITHIHVDYHGSSQLMITIQANKLWLIWPPSDHNLKLWGGHHKRKSDIETTMKLLREMKDLQVMHMKGKEAFILPPYHFHAVITFDVSAHASVELWNYEHFDISRKGAEWELRWAINSATHGFSKEDAFFVLDHLKGENANKFLALARAHKGNKRAAEVKKWAQAFLKDIEDGRQSVNRTNKRKRDD